MQLSTRAAAQDHLREFLEAEPFPGIDPVDGFVLCGILRPTNDGFDRLTWFARCGTLNRILCVSPTRFTPSQDRFAWLVRNDFPKPSIGVWDDCDIEYAIGCERLASDQRFAA